MRSWTVYPIRPMSFRCIYNVLIFVLILLTIDFHPMVGSLPSGDFSELTGSTHYIFNEVSGSEAHSNTQKKKKDIRKRNRKLLDDHNKI